MSLRILWPIEMAKEINTAGNPVPAVASTFTGAKAVVQDLLPEFISSNTQNSLRNRFILSETKGDLDAPVGDWVNVIIRVVDEASAILQGQASLLSIETAIDCWLMKSDVAGARGERLAIASDADVIGDANGNEVFVWEVSMSTFVKYSYRRAVANFPRTQDEANQDMKNLIDQIQQINPNFLVSFETF